MLFTVLLILLIGVVSASELQDNSTSSTCNETSKIVKKISTVSQTDSTRQNDMNENVQTISKNHEETLNKDTTIQTNKNTLNKVTLLKNNNQDIVVNTNENNILKAVSFTNLQDYIDDADEGTEIELHQDYSLANGGNTLNIAKNITINGNNRTISGDNQKTILNIGKGKTVVLKNIIFEKGKASDNGGAIFNGHASSSIKLIECVFRDNFADDYGGAIYSEGELTIINSKFQSNNAEISGGAIYSKGKIYSESSEFNKNKANGAVSHKCYGGAVYAEDICEIKSSLFDDNYSNNDGGAIYSLSTLTIDETEFTDNNVEVDGGAIFAKGKTTISNSKFKNNNAHGAHGSSSVRSFGGAIRSTGKCYVDSCTFDDNWCTYDENTAATSGGAIYADDDLTITGQSRFKNNQMRLGNGGAIYACKDVYINWNNDDDSSCVMDSNTAPGDCFGGAIYCQGNLYAKSLKCTSNSAYSGGAIYCEGQTHINNSEFSKNELLDSAEIRIPREGASIYSNGKCYIDSCTFSKGNGAEHGGAIFAHSDLTITGKNQFKSNIVNGTISQFDFDGGAIYCCGNLLVENTLFSDNFAAIDGGAIYCEGKTTISSSKFEGNTVKHDIRKCYGGAIRSNGIVTIDDCSFSNNHADNHGGAIYADTSIIIKKSTFIDNKAKVDGGAVYGDKSVSITSSIFRGNDATGETAAKSFGGAVRANDLIVVFDCDFSNNHAYNRGGAIYADTEIRISDSNFTANTAKDYGGAVYTSTLNKEASNSKFNKNKCTSGDGGAIYINNKCTPDFENCSFEENTAKKKGGGIYIDSKSAPLELYTCTFISNNAGDGGAVYTGIMTESTGNCIFLKNKATSGDGGAVYINNNCDPKFISCRFEYNSAKDEGGAMYLDSSHATLTLLSCTFVDNNAKSSGQSVYCCGYYNKISECWFGKNDVSQKDQFKIWHKAAADEDYTNYITTPIQMTVKLGNLYVGNTYKVNVKFIRLAFGEGYDIHHSTGEFYADNYEDAVFSNVKADNDDMSADVTIYKQNPTLHLRLDNQVLTLKLDTKDKNPSNVSIIPCEDVKYPNALKVEYEIKNMTDNATYAIIDEDTGDVVYEGKITKPQSTLSVHNLRPGKYYIGIYNPGNTTTSSSRAFAHFKVYASAAGSVTANNVTYGNPTTITLRTTVDGTYNVDIGSSVIEMEAIHGVCEKQINLGIGNYKTNTSRKNYDLDFLETTFKVDKTVNNVVVEVDNVTYGENSNIKVRADVDGVYDVIINETTYKIPVQNGLGNISLKLNAGSFNANVSFYDENYDTITHNATFDVYKADIDLVVVVFDEVYPDEIEVIVYASVDGDYELTVANDVTNVTVNDNFAYFKHDPLEVGTYQAIVSFEGDNNYNSIANMTTFTVYPFGTSFELEVNPSVVSYGNTATVTHTLSEGAGGTIKYFLNDGTFLGELDMSENLILPVFNVGNYVIIGNYSGDHNFIPAKDTTSFKVNPAENHASITVTNVTYGNESVIEVKADVDGIYHVDVNGTTHNITVKNGIGNKSISLDSGVYYAKVSFDSKNYNTTSNNTSFEVYKADTNMIVTAAYSVYPEEILGIVYSDVDGEYNLTIGEYSTIINVTEGYCEFNAGLFDVGNYTINVTYAGDRNHKSNTSSTNATVAKLVPNLSLVVQDIDYGDTALIVITSDVTGSVNVTANNKTETIILNQWTYPSSNSVSNIIKSKSRAFLTLDNLDVGIYPVTVVYNGNNNVESVNTSYDFEVNPAANNANVTAANVTYGEDTLIEITADVDGIYQLDVNGTVYNITVNNGIGNRTVSLNTGLYYANVTFDNKNYNTTTKNTTFTVYKGESIITITQQTAFIGENITFQATITDTKGNKLNDGKVIFKLNDLTLKDTNGERIFGKVENGIAEISYFIPYNYQAKTYKLTAVYGGNEQYIGSHSNTTSLDLKQREAEITLTSNNNIKINENITFNVTVTDKQDSTRLVNGYILFKINGLTLKDENGQTILVAIKDNKAKYNYMIGSEFSARKYNITALLINNTYTRSQTNNSFNITQTTTIIQLNTPILINNQVQITGQICNEEEETLPGTNKVVVKINGLIIKNATGYPLYYIINDGNINITLPEFNYRRNSYTIEVVTGQKGPYTGARENITLTIPKNNDTTVKSTEPKNS